ELVMPPLIEFLEGLLTGVGRDLDLQTFKITDQKSGRLMGIRADMTPQAARLDAHYLKREAPTRLCYLGSVLKSRPGPFSGSREPLQLGAELFGYRGAEADAEVLELALATLARAGVEGLFVDLGHVAPFRALMREADLTQEASLELLGILQRKATAELAVALNEHALEAAVAQRVMALLELHGPANSVLDRARAVLAGTTDIDRVLDELQQVVERLGHVVAPERIYIDLAELQGYAYYTGFMFSVLVPGMGEPLANGGRYDDIGKAFGRGRAAVGFSIDLRRLLPRVPHMPPGAGRIYAPPSADPALERWIRELRAQGERVVRGLPDSDADARALGCSREIVCGPDGWMILDREAGAENG
ncbi:MAG TPA: ATP phosphoribosyltransferase regulatory subunit, partial [Acidiferrobacteraceae bacterium]|nr:ATP phosphoribosyltransferase regulatory subunit [Acidiferrobacteraceae bacterium]